MAVHIPEHLSACTYLGQTVHSTTGPSLGRVDDVLADARSGASQWIVLRLRGPVPRHRALPLTLVLMTAHGLVVPVSRTALRLSPPIRVGADMTASQELQLQQYWKEY